MKLLAISGSLRAASTNTVLVETLPALAPAGVEVLVWRGLGELPHFNPDLDGDALPSVRELRGLVGKTDGLILCSPEYAHGVAGVMKNGLDWLVPSLEFPETPVALLNASPSAHYAQAHIRETLSVMQARIVEVACIAVPLQGRKVTAEDIVADLDLSGVVRAALSAFAETIAALPPKPRWD
jgi:chromate reductase, NAD(P)H dehydrogenase (quinone)